MASKGETDLSENFLKCSICMSQFKSPKMLPCIHSFCEECIEKYAAKQNGEEVPCPTCKKVCKLPETGVKGLQTNFHLTNLAEKVNLLEKLTSKETSASICDSCKNFKVVAFCVDCNFLICSKCKGHHVKFVLLQSHSIIPLKKLNDPKFQQEWKNARSPFCALHPSEKLRFYCKTCSKLICRDCTIVLHCKPQHDCREATIQFNESKEELNNLAQNSMGQLEKTMGYIEEGKLCLTALNTCKDRIEREITNHCHEIIKEIRKIYNKQRKDLLDEIYTRIEPVEWHVQLAQDWVKRMQTTQDMTHEIIKQNNPWELMAMSFDLSSAFEAMEVDSTTFQWGKSQLQHELAFSPGKLPDIKLGFQYPKGDVVASDKGGIFYLCTFDEYNEDLHITKIKLSNGKGETFKPHKWKQKISDGAKLVATVGRNQYTPVLLVGLGYYIIEFDCASMSYLRHYNRLANFVNTFMRVNTSMNELYLVGATAAVSYICSWNSGVLQYNKTNNFSSNSSIASMFVCTNSIFVYTDSDELKAYSVLNNSRYGYQNDQVVCYDLDPPKKLLNITETDILHCHLICSFKNQIGNTYVNGDNVNVFILWKGNMIKAGINTDKKAWILKEYNTGGKKVLGELQYVNGEAPKPPSALKCKKTDNGGMQIHICDDLGNITTYNRGSYNRHVVLYEME